MKKAAKKKPKKTGPNKLAMREERFPYEYVIDLNATKAAIRCGYSERSARTLGARLFAKDNIQSKIKELQAAQKTSAIKTAEDWDREIDIIAFCRTHKEFYKEDGTLKDIKDLTDEQMALVNEIEHKTYGGGEKPIVKVTNIKIHDKMKALDMKGKRLGIYKETREVVTETYVEKIKRLRGIIDSRKS